MSKQKGAATQARVDGPIESNAAARQVSPARQRTGAYRWLGGLRGQLLDGVEFFTAPVLAVIDRDHWTEVIVLCVCGCGRAHRHHIGHYEDSPVVRRVRCGADQTTTYVVDPDPSGLSL